MTRKIWLFWRLRCHLSDPTRGNNPSYFVLRADIHIYIGSNHSGVKFFIFQVVLLLLCYPDDSLQNNAIWLKEINGWFNLSGKYLSSKNYSYLFVNKLVNYSVQISSTNIFSVEDSLTWLWSLKVIIVNPKLVSLSIWRCTPMAVNNKHIALHELYSSRI